MQRVDGGSSGLTDRHVIGTWNWMFMVHTKTLISPYFDTMFLAWGETDDLGARGFLSLAIMSLIQHSFNLVNSKLPDACLLHCPAAIVLVRIVSRDPSLCV
jgi:hypothetical protein